MQGTYVFTQLFCLPFEKLWSLTKESTLPSLLFSFFYCLAEFQYRKQHRFSCSVWVDDGFSKWMVVEAFLRFPPHLNHHSSVIKENSDSGCIRTHASEDTAALTQRLRPLGHPACKIWYRPTFVFVQGLHPLSRASLEVIAFCNLPFHGFYFW